MITVEKLWNWYLIENKFFFTSDEINWSYVNLTATRWKDMNYGKNTYLSIDYPGEYDKDDFFVKVYEWDTQRLNFLIKYDGKTICLIQTPGLLEKEELPTVNYWIYNDPYTATLLEKIELAWEKIQID